MIALYLLLFSCIYANLKQAISEMPEMSQKGSPYYWPDYVANFSQEYYDDLTLTNLKRKALFEKNAMWIKKWNEDYARGLHDFELGIGFMSAMTEEEKNAHYMHLPSSNFEDNAHSIEKHIRQGNKEIDNLYEQIIKIEATPKETTSETNKDVDVEEEDWGELDWRDYGIVSPIRYQGSCGGCYAFSAIHAIESAYALRTGKLDLLSAQHIIDCTRKEEYTYNPHLNAGCSGGYINNSFYWVMQNGGVALEKDYAFIRKEGPCRKDVKLASPIQGYMTLPKDNQKILKLIVDTMGPVAVTIYSSLDSFRYFTKSTVYADPDCSVASGPFSHTLVVVGYGTLDGVGYWLCQNSWGKRWGDKGFIKIKRENNICGIASMAYIPVIPNPSDGWIRNLRETIKSYKGYLNFSRSMPKPAVSHTVGNQTYWSPRIIEPLLNTEKRRNKLLPGFSRLLEPQGYMYHPFLSKILSDAFKETTMKPSTLHVTGGSDSMVPHRSYVEKNS